MNKIKPDLTTKPLKFFIKYGFLIVLCFLVNRGFLSALTTAEEMERLLGAQTITYAQAARFVLEASEVMRTGYYEVAFDFAVQRKWLPKTLNANDPARLDRISLLLMHSFYIEGGLFYSVIGTSNYAYRELVHKNIIQGRSDPHMMVSGEMLLFYINRIFSLYEGTQDEVKMKDRRLADRGKRRERSEELAAMISAIIREHRIEDTTVEATDEGILITLSNINFLPDSAALPDAEKRKLNDISTILKRMPNVRLFIAGHTTRSGTAEGRLELSINRAREAANYLISQDACKEKDIMIAGYGADRILIDNTTPAAMAANRRVEIMILEY